MNAPRKSSAKRWIIAAKIVLSAAILAWLAWGAWAEGQFERLVSGEKHWEWLGVALLASLAAHFTGFIRWYWMGHALELPLTVSASLKIGLIGTFFSLVAFGVVGGDGLRAWYAARKSPGRRAEAVASVFLDRAIGMFTMFLFAAIGYWWCRDRLATSGDSASIQAIQWMCYASLVISVVGIVGILAMLQVSRFRKTKWFRKLTGLPKVGPILQRMTAIFMLYRNRPDAIAGGFGLSMVVNVFFAIGIWSVAMFLPGNHPGLGEHLVIAPISMVANSFPLPGGIGAMEAALPFLYRGFMTTAESGAAGAGTSEVLVAFVFRLTLLAVAALGAFAWFTTDHTLRDEIRHIDE